jgi:hypothetical protein
MYELVMEDDVARLRNASEESGISIEARIPEQTGGSTMKGRYLVLQSVRVCRIAIQQS